MTYPRTESFRDDYELDPNVHPAMAHVLHQLSAWHSMDTANRSRWPFPSELIPPDRHRAPTNPDSEPAPW